MELNITQKAQDRLKELNIKRRKYLLLWYDRDGCGCGVNGIPTIRLINEQEEFYEEVKNELIRTFVPKQQSVFFNKNLNLDYVNGCFRLSSPEQVLNPFIPENSICMD